MKLSTRGRYGIHAMFDLAKHYDAGEAQSIKQIAERQEISEAYLEQLVAVLRRAGLVNSIRGAQGGYTLSRPPEYIAVGEILRSLEGDFALADCLLEEDACDRACRCPTRLVWQKLRDGLNEIADGITLHDMLQDEARLNAEE